MTTKVKDNKNLLLLALSIIIIAAITIMFIFSFNKGTKIEHGLTDKADIVTVTTNAEVNKLLSEVIKEKQIDTYLYVIDDSKDFESFDDLHESLSFNNIYKEHIVVFVKPNLDKSDKKPEIKVIETEGIKDNYHINTDNFVSNDISSILKGDVKREQVDSVVFKLAKNIHKEIIKTK